MKSLLSLIFSNFIRRQSITGNFFVNVWVTSHKAVLTQTASSGALNHVSSFPLITLLSYTNFCCTVLNPFPPMTAEESRLDFGSHHYHYSNRQVGQTDVLSSN